MTLAVIQTALAATYFEWTAHDGVQVSTVVKKGLQAVQDFLTDVCDQLHP